MSLRTFIPDRLRLECLRAVREPLRDTQSHRPFGEDDVATNATDQRRFTTYERDSDGSDYAMNRQYSNVLGRFFHVHPVGSYLALPQASNGYSYSIDDPSNLQDPLGLSPEIRYCYSVQFFGLDTPSRICFTSADSTHPPSILFPYAVGLFLDAIYSRAVFNAARVLDNKGRCFKFFSSVADSIGLANAIGELANATPEFAEGPQDRILGFGSLRARC